MDELAMINGKVIRKNHIVEGFTVVEIQDRYITLARNGRCYTLNMQRN